jgi:FixJ family two-component response regulator
MKKRPAHTVFIVDDDAAVRDSVAELVASVGLHPKCYESGPAFLEAAPPTSRGCLVLDVRMAEMSGLDVQQRLAGRGDRRPVIILTGHGDVPVAVRAMKAGAVDFLQKPYRDQALLDAIQQALCGLPSDTASQQTILRDVATLTSREREVLEQVLADKTSKEIAENLQISSRTAEAHRRNLLRKLGFATTRELRARMRKP